MGIYCCVQVDKFFFRVGIKVAKFRKSNAKVQLIDIRKHPIFQNITFFAEKNDKFTLSYTQMQKYSDVAGQNQFCDKIDTRQKH